MLATFDVGAVGDGDGIVDAAMVVSAPPGSRQTLKRKRVSH